LTDKINISFFGLDESSNQQVAFKRIERLRAVLDKIDTPYQSCVIDKVGIITFLNGYLR